MRGGQKFVLDAKVSGVPAPKTSWLFNGQPLTTSPPITVDATASIGKLTFAEVKAVHAGVYTLQAENSVGKTQAEFTLVVKGLSFRRFTDKNSDILIISFHLFM